MPKHKSNSGIHKRRLNIHQLKERLGVHSQTIWRWYSKGGITPPLPPPHYLGQARLWWEHEIEQWEAQAMRQREVKKASGERKRLQELAAMGRAAQVSR